MNFGRSFQFVFEDSDWFKKIGIMALVNLIPIVGQLVLLGWGAEIIRRTTRGADVPLPDLDFGEQLGDGFKLAVVGIVYSLPASILFIIMSVVSGIAIGMDNDASMAISMMSYICLGGVALIYSIAIGLLMPAAYANTAVKGSIGDGLRVGEVFGYFKKNIGSYLLVFLGSILAGLGASLVGGIACGIGVLLTTIYANAIIMQLTGQAYKISIES
jgi:hypothetical protein